MVEAAQVAEVRIRRGLPTDAAEIAGFQREMARETEALELDPETLHRGVEGVFADPARGHYWVAEEDGRLLACLLVTSEWSDWRNGTVWWFHSVYVVPEARGRGIFRRLYDHLRRTVEANPEVKGLRLYVERSNRAAQEVYARVGMNKEHYELFEWLKG